MNLFLFLTFLLLPTLAVSGVLDAQKILSGSMPAGSTTQAAPINDPQLWMNINYPNLRGYDFSISHIPVGAVPVCNDTVGGWINYVHYPDLFAIASNIYTQMQAAINAGNWALYYALYPQWWPAYLNAYTYNDNAACNRILNSTMANSLGYDSKSKYYNYNPQTWGAIDYLANIFIQNNQPNNTRFFLGWNGYGIVDNGIIGAGNPISDYSIYACASAIGYTGYFNICYNSLNNAISIAPSNSLLSNFVDPNNGTASALSFNFIATHTLTLNSNSSNILGQPAYLLYPFDIKNKLLSIEQVLQRNQSNTQNSGWRVIANNASAASINTYISNANAQFTYWANYYQSAGNSAVAAMFLSYIRPLIPLQPVPANVSIPTTSNSISSYSYQPGNITTVPTATTPSVTVKSRFCIYC